MNSDTNVVGAGGENHIHESCDGGTKECDNAGGIAQEHTQTQTPEREEAGITPTSCARTYLL